MAPRDVVTADGMTWRTVELEQRCSNLSCSNELGEGRFVLLIEERPPAVVAEGVPHSPGPSMVLLVCAPCAAVLRGEQR